MNAKEIRDLSKDAIAGRLNDAREELMKLHFQQATGELTDTTRLRVVRRDIARMLTILHEMTEEAAETEGAK